MEMMTVQLPKPLFERLERAAKRLHRPVDEYIRKIHPLVVSARRIWSSAGYHPPAD